MLSDVFARMRHRAQGHPDPRRQQQQRHRRRLVAPAHGPRQPRDGDGDVTAFQGYGFGVYCYFSTNSGVASANALTSPTSSGVQWHDMVTVSLGGVTTISHNTDNTDGTVDSGGTVADLTS